MPTAAEYANGVQHLRNRINLNQNPHNQNYNEATHPYDNNANRDPTGKAGDCWDSAQNSPNFVVLDDIIPGAGGGGVPTRRRLVEYVIGNKHDLEQMDLPQQEVGQVRVRPASRLPPVDGEQPRIKRWNVPGMHFYTIDGPLGNDAMVPGRSPLIPIGWGLTTDKGAMAVDYNHNDFYIALGHTHDNLNLQNLVGHGTTSIYVDVQSLLMETLEEPNAMNGVAGYPANYFNPKYCFYERNDGRGEIREANGGARTFSRMGRHRTSVAPRFQYYDDFEFVDPNNPGNLMVKKLKIGFCGMMLVGAVLLGVSPLFSQIDGAFVRYEDTLNGSPRIGIGHLRITPFRVGYDALYCRGEKWGSIGRNRG